jgi:hypothetical protein
MRRGHHDAGKWFALRMDEHHAQGDQGFARSALSHDVSTPRNLPSPGDTHDGQGLCWIRAAKQS